MKTSTIAVIAVAAIAVVGLGAYMIDIDQTQEARLPTVSVDVEGGQLPEFEANTGSISIEQETVEIDVPKVEVTTETEVVEIPTLNIQPAREGDG